MTVCWLMVSDSRSDVHDQAFVSAFQSLPSPDHFVLVDDREHRLGFGGAVAEGWRMVLRTGADWIVHLELDFTFNEPPPIGRMIRVLERQRGLLQMSLKRQPVNEREKAAGGIVEADPGDFLEVVHGQDRWTEHRRYFTTNPSVYSTQLCELGWPEGAESEGRFTHELLDRFGPAARFGIWGGKHDPPRVEHIGHRRVGWGY